MATALDSLSTQERMLNVARQRARQADLRYRRHVMVTCSAECATGGVCRTGRALDLGASAAHWRVERLRRG